MTNFEWMLKNDKEQLKDLIDGRWNCLYCEYTFICSKSPAGCEGGNIDWLLAERKRDWEKEPMTLKGFKEYQAEMLLMEQFKAALMNNKEKEK